MDINIFHLDYAQPLVWVALALLSVVSVPALLSPYEVENSRLFIFFPRLKWFYTTIFAVVAVIWLAIVILNHQTILGDVIDFAFLLGFSVVWMYASLLGYLLIFAAFCVLSGIVLSLYALLLFVVLCIGRLFLSFIPK